MVLKEMVQIMLYFIKVKWSSIYGPEWQIQDMKRNGHKGHEMFYFQQQR